MVFPILEVGAEKAWTVKTTAALLRWTAVPSEILTLNLENIGILKQNIIPGTIFLSFSGSEKSRESFWNAFAEK